MAIPVKLQSFEGPLDLLLHLIEKNKVSIYDIPIAMITDQYMEYIHAMQEEDLEIMSEFILMAATLLEIKARLLLPAPEEEEEETEDPRDELVRKLLEYKMYRYMSGELREYEQEAAFTLYHCQDIPAEVLAYREPVDLNALLGDMQLTRLQDMFQDILKRQEERLDPIRSRFGSLEKEEVDLNETMEQVTSYIEKSKKCTFRNLLTRRKSRTYTVIAFLTLLQLMKEGRIEVEQNDTFSEIYIRSVA